MIKGLDKIRISQFKKDLSNCVNRNLNTFRNEKTFKPL